MVEMEGKGLDFERYALRKLFRRLVRERGIRTVLEIPAKGEKAMPSLYSLAFAEAGCEVTLVNSEPRSRPAWTRLNLPVHHIECGRPDATELASGSYDLVWNFMSLSQQADKPALLKEMIRLSRRDVLFIAVNRFNPGFFSHRMAHRIFDVPWNHGDIRYMNPFFVMNLFRDQGLHIAERGAVDCPPYPDSLGIRDMKLHRKNVDLNRIEWDSRTLEWMKTGRYPLKIRAMYLCEAVPLPFLVKLFYAHLTFVLGEKTT